MKIFWIIIPALNQGVYLEILQALNKGYKYIVIEGEALLKTGIQQVVDEMWVVSVDRDQISRILAEIEKNEYNHNKQKDGGVNVNDEQDKQGIFSYNAEDIIREIERLGHVIEKDAGLITKPLDISSAGKENKDGGMNNINKDYLRDRILARLR